MRGRWIGKDGWPCTFAESQTGAGLIKAMRSLPRGEDLSAEDAENFAHMVYMSSSFGMEEELPRSRPATRAASEAELRRLYELADKLREHIEQLHRPAVVALHEEGEHIFALVPTLEALQENCRQAFGSVEDGKKDPGEKVEAAEIAFAASMVFERIAGRRPTLVRHNGKLKSNAWTNFLTDVYEALGFETKTSKRSARRPTVSVESQTNRLLKRAIEKPRGKTGQ